MHLFVRILIDLGGAIMGLMLAGGLISFLLAVFYPFLNKDYDEVERQLKDWHQEQSNGVPYKDF